MKIPLLPPVVPSHVFCLLADGVTWANVRRDPVPGFADTRHFPVPANTVGAGPTGTPLLSRDALADAVDVARKVSGGRLTRASVVFPDSWARILPIDFDTLPQSEDSVRDMVLWKLKKLLPGISEDLSVVFEEMPKAGEGGELRLLVAAAPTEMIRSIEQSFESVGVRVGLLAPASFRLENLALVAQRALEPGSKLAAPGGSPSGSRSGAVLGSVTTPPMPRWTCAPSGASR